MSRRRTLNFPVSTLGMLGIALAVHILPGAAPIFIYDRSAIAAGEVWRLITCHFVHFSSAHLFCNLAAFGVAGWIIEQKEYPLWKTLCLSTALFISAGLFLAKPGMRYYGGLSGLACGAIFYMALHGLCESKPWKLMWAIVLFVLSVKIGMEVYLDRTVLNYGPDRDFVSMHLGHVIGGIVAVSLFRITNLKVRNGRSWMRCSVPVRAEYP